VYSLISKGDEVEVDETKEKFSLNMAAVERRGLIRSRLEEK
jgi:hypothetical protein